MAITIRPNETELQLIEKIKRKHQIKTTSKALFYASDNLLQLEERLKRTEEYLEKAEAENRHLKQKIENFRNAFSALQQLNLDD